MSASLASARMNSRQFGSAWIAASLRSSDLIISAASAPAVALAQTRRSVTRDRRRAELPSPPAPIVTRTGRRAGGGLRGRGRSLAPRPGLPAALGLLLRTWSIVSRSTWRRVLERRDFLGPELDLELGLDPLAADDGRHRDADVAHAVRPRSRATTPAGCAAIEGDGVDHLADRQADGEPRAPLQLDHLGAAALGASEEGLGLVAWSSRGTSPAAARRPARPTRSAPCCRRARPGSGR